MSVHVSSPCYSTSTEHLVFWKLYCSNRIFLDVDSHMLFCRFLICLSHLTIKGFSFCFHCPHIQSISRSMRQSVEKDKRSKKEKQILSMQHSLILTLWENWSSRNILLLPSALPSLFHIQRWLCL